MASAGGAQTAGRPTRLPRSARRKQLLAAAQEVFVAQGYHAAAMDDIAERAGVSKPVLYQHFPGKLELYLALLDTHCDAIVAQGARGDGAPPPTTRSGSAARCAAYFDFVDHESEAFRLVFESDLRNEPAVRERVERVESGLHRGHHRHDHLRHRRQPGRAPSCSPPAWSARPRPPPSSGWPAAGRSPKAGGRGAGGGAVLARHRQLPAAGRVGPDASPAATAAGRIPR